MLEVLSWSCAAINRFWRLVYSHSNWIPRVDAQRLVEDGWAFIAPGMMMFCESRPRVIVSVLFALGWLQHSVCVDRSRWHPGVLHPPQEPHVRAHSVAC